METTATGSVALTIQPKSRAQRIFHSKIKLIINAVRPVEIRVPGPANMST